MRINKKRNTYRGLGRIPAMAFGWSWFINNGFITDYYICMILESIGFYIIILALGFVWIYLTE